MQKTPDKKIARMAELRAQGLPFAKIGTMLNVHRDTVRRCLDPKVAQKECLKSSKYYATHREEIHLRANKYRETHREELRLKAAAYFKSHREECRLRSAVWHQAHPEYGHLYYKNHREYILQQEAKYRKMNPDKDRQRGIKYRRAHPSEGLARCAKRRALLIGAVIGMTAERKLEIAEIYRRAKEDRKVRCYLCGELIPKKHRHVDHIIPLSKGGIHKPSNLAVACDSCNDSKGSKMPENIGLLL